MKGIDLSRPFMPERLTPLFHAPSYARLTPPQRLRYNQLHACYCNEQTMFFEVAVARNVLDRLLRDPLPERVREGLHDFIAEEKRHTEMFRDANAVAAPEYYRGREFFFIAVPRAGGAVLDWMTRRPRLFPLLLWLMLLQEERAMFFAKEFIRDADALEPLFVEVQRKHLADEVGHVAWDGELLDAIWPRTSRMLRAVNARLFAWMLGEFFNTPKRAVPRVVEVLAEEFPELRPLLPAMRAELRGLAENRAFCEASYSRAATPKAFARFDQWPEFASLARVLRGYVPQSANAP